MDKISFHHLTNNQDGYAEIRVQADKILKAYRKSVFSFEWLDNQGAIKTADTLPPKEKDKRANVLSTIERGEKLPLPVLGMGIKDTIEFGSGRPEFMVAAEKGLDVIPVKIRRSMLEDFQPFLADVE